MAERQHRAGHVLLQSTALLPARRYVNVIHLVAMCLHMNGWESWVVLPNSAALFRRFQTQPLM